MAEAPEREDWELKVDAFTKYMKDKFNQPIVSKQKYRDSYLVSFDDEEQLAISFPFVPFTNNEGNKGTISFVPTNQGSVRCSVVKQYATALQHVRDVVLPHCNWGKGDY
jgi:hypothetical protein